MLWHTILAGQVVLSVATAQGIRRLSTPYPALERRQFTNSSSVSTESSTEISTESSSTTTTTTSTSSRTSSCSNSCSVCAGAYKVGWLRTWTAFIQTLTVIEVVNTEDGSTSTTTLADGVNVTELSIFNSLTAQGRHTSLIEDLGLIM
jgi:hypothetical protein